MRTIITVTGIRPDFIRMSALFRELDVACNHIMIHTGQHYDRMLSDVFFQEMQIRKPDFNLEIGGSGKQHYHQLSDLQVKLMDLLKSEDLSPDIVLFLGDSNSVLCAPVLKKEGYCIGHIEAGMRSYDRRMLEEINRVVCDHVSDLLFVYHDDYRKQCLVEGIKDESVLVVGNTIVEVCKPLASQLMVNSKQNRTVLVDIHRPENFKYPGRMQHILKFIRETSQQLARPAQILRFPRTFQYLEQYKSDLTDIEIIDLMSYKSFLQAQYHAAVLISDSGTAQEEAALLGTPVLVPRDFTERPQSVTHNCSVMVNVNTRDGSWASAWQWLANRPPINTDWLGSGNTAKMICERLLA